MAEAMDLPDLPVALADSLECNSEPLFGISSSDFDITESPLFANWHVDEDTSDESIDADSFSVDDFNF